MGYSLRINKEKSPSSRAHCRHCRRKIKKGTERCLVKPGDMSSRYYYHTKCLLKHVLESVTGRKNISGDQIEEILLLLKI